MRERETGTLAIPAERSPSGGGDGMDDVVERPASSERDAAINECLVGI